MTKLWIDLETRSKIDLPKCGLYNYAYHDSTAILIASYAINNGPVHRWTLGTPMPDALLRALTDKRVQVRAHNAPFERHLIKGVLGLDIPLDRWYCTSMQARASALPAGLDDLAVFLKAKRRKNPEGVALMRLLSMPQADGSFCNDADAMERYGIYCDDDVEAMRVCSQAIPELTEEALAVWRANEIVNDRGLPIDLELCELATHYAEQEHAEAAATVQRLTGGAVKSARGTTLTRWVYDHIPPQYHDIMERKKDGRDTLSLDAATREALTLVSDADPDAFDANVIDVLDAAEAASSGSTAKFQRMYDMASPDGRLRGAFIANGASGTGRFCVDGDTLIDTPMGRVPIRAIQIGDMVLTHRGRYREVVAQCTKGDELMYRVETADGWVICTRGHRILHDGEWKRVDQFEAFGRQETAGEGGVAVYDEVQDAGDDSRSGAPHLCDSIGNIARGHNGSAAQSSDGFEPLQVQDGCAKPYVRGEEGEAEAGAAAGLSRGVERLRIHRTASADCGEGVGIEGPAGGVGCASHRRRPGEQRAGQPMSGDNLRASEATRGYVQKVEAVGTRTVYDITVAEDSSYQAQGMTHHNSSKGAQLHNFPRSVAKDPDAIFALMRKKADLGGPVLQTLKSMLRPAICPGAGRQIVRGDWNAIEARGLPWLTGRAQAVQYLDAFTDPTRDIYVEQAVKAGLGDNRQAGKVVVLSLGYGGASGALSAMSKNYGVTIADKQAVVTRWRGANRWAPDWWKELEITAKRAIQSPTSHWRDAGRVAFRHSDADQLPALLMQLPSGRVLTYPYANVIPSEYGSEISYLKAAWKPKADAKEWPRATLWGGLAAENATQAACADLLRHALVKGVRDGLPLIGHVHDELICESATRGVMKLAKDIERCMLDSPEWASGLPLAVETDASPRYRK